MPPTASTALRASAHAGDSHHHMALPRVPLIGMALLVAATVLVVFIVRVSGLDVSSASRAPVVAERVLHFEDRSDGGIAVMDGAPAAGAPALLQVIAPGSNGFLRGTLRALVRERRLAGVGPEQPFHLAAHADGRLTLFDPATARRVDLESFGPTNAAVFAQLLPSARPSAAPR